VEEFGASRRREGLEAEPLVPRPSPRRSWSDPSTGGRLAAWHPVGCSDYHPRRRSPIVQLPTPLTLGLIPTRAEPSGSSGTGGRSAAAHCPSSGPRSYCGCVPEQHRPRMSRERVELLRRWHEASHAELRAMLPADVSFMSLQLHVTENVFPVEESADGDPYHRAVADAVAPGLRVLDMGTGSGVSALLAARAGSEVVAVDVNAEAVACARANAERNGLSEQITFVHGDLFQGVVGDFDLIIFDPPFRWFEPRDLLERSHADADYRTLTRFMAEAPGRLRIGGRIVMNFGTSGDLAYLHELIGRSGLVADESRYGESTKFGYTAVYYVITLEPILESERKDD
jgi:release factor glutamine methyltransferase